MGLMLPPNWCLLFIRDPTAQFTPSWLRVTLEDASATVTGEEQPFEVRWEYAPALLISIERRKELEVLIGRLAGWEHRFQKYLPGCDTEIRIICPDLEETLDEINTLIDAQMTLQTATRGLMYRSWNQSFAAPDE